MKNNAVIAALLAAVMLFTCIPAAYANGNSENLKEITGLSLSSKTFYSCDFEGSELLVVATDFKKTADNYELYLINAETAEISKSAVFKATDFRLNNVTDCSINEDGSYTVYDETAGKTSVFDADLNYKSSGTCKKKSDSYESLGKDNALISSKFVKYADCARCAYSNYFTEPTYATAFYDDNSAVYLSDDKDIESVYSVNGKKCLTGVSSTDKHIAKFAVYDYTAKSYVTTSTQYLKGYNLTSPSFGVLDDEYAFTVAESDKKGESFFTPYIWKYSAETENTAFETKRLTVKDIDKFKTDYSTQLKNKYAINVLVDVVPKTYPTYRDNKTGKEYGGVVKGANTFDTYLILKDLCGYLSYFPAGFTAEMTNFGGRKRKFDIYIDKEVMGESAAFANRVDGFFICFATDEYYSSLIPHEMFHLIDGRIEHYFTGLGKSYEKEWNKLNPSGFVYYANQDYKEEYFATAYAMTDSKEDRADTFEILFEAYKDTVHPYSKNGVRRKAIYISESIRSAFPSVRKSGASWERWIVPYPVKVKFKSTDNYIKVYWSECRTAATYEVQQKQSGVWKTVSLGAKKKYVVKGLKAGTVLSFRIRACKNEGNHRICSSWQYVTAATTPPATKITRVSTNSKHKISAKWKKVKKCDGYEVQFAAGKNFKNVIATRSVSKTGKSYVGKGFTKGKKYYVRVRTYKLAGSKRVYSAWSKVKGIKSK